LSRPKQNQHQEELWVGEHVITQHQLHLRQRVDRQLFLSLVEQKRQILMVRADLFGDIENQHVQQDPSHPAIRGAAELMIKVASLYAENKISRGELTETRNKLLKERGAATPTNGVRTKNAKGATSNRSSRLRPSRRRPLLVLASSGRC
jgi:hypothetical protein